MSDTPPKFVVFNYVTSKIEQTDTAPNWGDPNAALQAQVSNAYSGSVSGAASLSSGTVTAPTPSTLGEPAAEAIALAQTSLPPEQAQQVVTAFGSIGAMGQTPAMLSSMHAHATSVLDNATKVFDALDTVVNPEQAGNANRCNSLGDYIGSIQGNYNRDLQGITGGLGQITNALISVPTTIIGGFVTAANGLITAITSGITGAINRAISAVNTVTSSLFEAVGGAITRVFDLVGAAVTKVQQAIQGEISRLTSVLSRMISNPFRLVVPNVSPCIAGVYQNSNPEAAGTSLASTSGLDTSNLSFADRLFLQNGIDDPNLAAQTIAARQRAAAAMGVSQSEFSNRYDAGIAAARSP